VGLNRGLLDDEWQSKELKSGEDIDEGDIDEPDNDKEGYGNFSTFSMPKRMGEYKWEVGTYLSEKAEFVEAIRTYALENGRSLIFLKSDKKESEWNI